MRKKTRVQWSAEALDDLRRLQRKVTEAGAPRTAKAFVSRLRKYASGRLRDFPESGSVVEEFNDPSVRDILFKEQRIIFRYDGVFVTILNVVHGSHVLKPPKLQDE